MQGNQAVGAVYKTIKIRLNVHLDPYPGGW